MITVMSQNKVTWLISESGLFSMCLAMAYAFENFPLGRAGVAYQCNQMARPQSTHIR